METENYLFSFVCGNEKPESVRQLILQGLERHNGIITRTLITDSLPTQVSYDNHQLQRLRETLEKLEKTSANFKEIKGEILERIINTAFIAALIKANEENYVDDLLNFHFIEYRGKKEDFINYFKQKRFDHFIKLKIWLEKQHLVDNRSETEETNQSIQTKEGVITQDSPKKGLSALEKLILIELAQRKKFFIKLDGDQNTSGTQLNIFLSAIMGYATDNDVRKKRKVAIQVIKGNLAEPQINSKLTNIKNIKEITDLLKIPELTEALNAVDKKIKDLKIKYDEAKL